VALLTTGVATDVAAVSNIGDVTDPDAANSSTTTTTTITPVPAPITPVPAPITLLPILPLTPLTLKPPVLRQSADLSPVSGSVMVRLAGSATFVPLSTATNVPTGSTINADEGTISLTTTLPNGSTQTGQFYDGEFVLTQSANGTVILTLAGGSFTGCPAPAKDKSANALSASVHKKPTTVIRQLWGNAHGDYTTKGRYGSAAVSGTVWLTQDRCDGTFVRVTRDNVIVVAYAHPKKKHNVKQGRHLLVPAPSV
jgi:hypothetical protein